MKPSTYPNTPAAARNQTYPPAASLPARLARGLKRGSLYTLGGLFAVITGLMVTVLVLYWQSVLMFLFGG